MEDDAGTAGRILEKTSDSLPGGIETIASIHDDWMETRPLLNTKKHRSVSPDALIRTGTSIIAHAQGAR